MWNYTRGEREIDGTLWKKIKSREDSREISRKYRRGSYGLLMWFEQISPEAKNVDECRRTVVLFQMCLKEARYFNCDSMRNTHRSHISRDYEDHSSVWIGVPIYTIYTTSISIYNYKYRPRISCISHVPNLKGMHDVGKREEKESSKFELHGPSGSA